MDNENYEGTDVEYETESEKKGFKITRGILLLGILILVIIVIIIIIVINKKPNKTNNYTEVDFKKLENRMEEEAPVYISQKQINVEEEQIKIDLKELLYENGGTIDSSKNKAVGMCKGYVIVKKNPTESYKAYIKCDDKYTTKGYVESDNDTKVNKTTKKTTTKKKVESKPNILIIGEPNISIKKGETYKELGADATDEVDGDISSKVTISGKVDTSKVGTYVITYKIKNSRGVENEAKRTVTVSSYETTTKKVVTTSSSKNNVVITTTKGNSSYTTIAPTITLKGNSVLNLTIGTPYSEPGYTAYDANGKNITSSVVVTSNLNISSQGTYSINYSVIDSYGNKTVKTRYIKVTSSYISLKGITLSPSGVIQMKIGETKSVSIYFNPTNASNKSVSWKVSDSSVATINNNVITARKVGTTKITVFGADSKSYSVTVNVSK